ncbi:MAG TPA: hypothetical protein VKV32_16410 [Stellaceae bacterium]|nr:hypothetical protein [Stellaceae bacterium]
MSCEPDLEDLLCDDIMEPVMRSAHVTRDDLRRQLSDLAQRHRTAGKAETKD